MASDTLPMVYRPLMEAESVRLGYCAVCGRTYPLEQHHIVWRSWGKLFEKGREVPKPTVTLCGFGNNLYDADGKPYCHGRAHNHMLHFKYDDRLMVLETAEPVDYMKALGMDGWRPLFSDDSCEPPRCGYCEDIPF